MPDSNSRLSEFLKRIGRYGKEPELVKETEWSYTYKTEGKSYATISKFLADEAFTVGATEIRLRWPNMDERERLDFVQNFWSKPNWNENDTEILEIIMQDGNDRLWESCAQAFLKHPDRDRIIRFLIQRLEQQTDHEPLNYIQALGLSKDARAVPAIRPYFEKYRKGMESEKATGVPDDVVFGPIPYHPYFVAAGALLKIDGSSEYEQAIRQYLNHQSEQVRYWAEHALEIEGPTTAKRNAEYMKRYKPSGRGRDDHHGSPPAQNRTGASTHTAPTLDVWRESEL